MEVITRKQAKEQGLKRYFTGKPCKHGHIAERTVTGGCVVCVAKSSLASHHKHKESRLEKQRDYHLKTKEIRNAKTKEWVENNKDKKIELDKQYRLDNKVVINEKKKIYLKARRTNDEKFNLKLFMRKCIERSMKNKTDTTQNLLGYTGQQLKSHLESLFTDGMSWDNYGFGEGKWVIDHIYPIAQHIRDGETDPAIINALDNLQPMWFNENAQKSDKVL